MILMLTKHPSYLFSSLTIFVYFVETKKTRQKASNLGKNRASYARKKL